MHINVWMANHYDWCPAAPDEPEIQSLKEFPSAHCPIWTSSANFGSRTTPRLYQPDNKQRTKMLQCYCKWGQ